MHAPSLSIASVTAIALFLQLQLVDASPMMNSANTIRRMKPVVSIHNMTFRRNSLSAIQKNAHQRQRTTSMFVPPPEYSSNVPSFIRHTIRSQKIRYLHRSLASSAVSPNWEQITNHKTSKTVKLFKSVHRANKSKRSELGLTIAEGVRLVSDVLKNNESRHLVRRIIISESLLYDIDNNDQYQQELQHWLHVVEEESKQSIAQYANDEGESYTPQTCSINIGTDEVVSACSATVTSQGVVALMDVPQPYDPLVATAANDSNGPKIPPFYLILDGLSDPGNVGTLLRTCAASHVTALILLPGSCDVWNPKAVRSAMGASFRVPVLELNKIGEKQALDEVLDVLQRCGVENSRVFAATMEASGGRESLAHYNIDFSTKGGAAVILGREGEGLRSDVRDAIKQGKISTVHVPMAPGTESLNAAVCGSVIMFERMRQLIDG